MLGRIHWQVSPYTEADFVRGIKGSWLKRALKYDELLTYHNVEMPDHRVVDKF